LESEGHGEKIAYKFERRRNNNDVEEEMRNPLYMGTSW
jgi:hypothetical protein